MPKRPSFQFYPGDWLRDGISGCSLAAQGLWLRMMIVMHDSPRYGRLCLPSGKPMPNEMLARHVGVTKDICVTLLDELKNAGVPSQDSDGIFFSRRMVNDERERKKWAQRQRKHRDTKSVCHADVTPMSQLSSSSSSSSNLNTKPRPQNPRATSFIEQEQRRKIEAKTKRETKEEIVRVAAHSGDGPSSGRSGMGMKNLEEYVEFKRLRAAKKLPDGVTHFTSYLDYLERTIPGFVRQKREEETQTEAIQ